MGTCETVGRVLLVVINILFLLIGLAFFAAGLFAKFGQDILNKQIDSVLESLKASSASSTLGTIDFSDFNITDLLNGVAIGFICFGLFLCIITILGCLGGCCKIRILLIGYIITCLVLLTGQIIIIGILYGSPDTFHDPAKKALKDSIQANYGGLNSTDVVSAGWNVAMQQLKCCGASNYQDFTGASKWVIDYTALTPSVTLKTPLACCKTLPTSQDLTCAGATASDSDNYLNIGCYQTIWDLTLGNTAIVAGSLAGIAVFQLLLIVFGFVVCCSAKNNKTEPDNYKKGWKA